MHISCKGCFKWQRRCLRFKCKFFLLKILVLKVNDAYYQCDYKKETKSSINYTNSKNFEISVSDSSELELNEEVHKNRDWDWSRWEGGSTLSCNLNMYDGSMGYFYWDSHGLSHKDVQIGWCKILFCLSTLISSEPKIRWNDYEGH